MYKAKFLSPMIPSFNILETSKFFIELLDFSIVMESPNYAILLKDGLTVHILPAGNHIGQMEFYLQVNDVDAIWNYIKDKVIGISVKGPFNQKYGMRELHIEIPHTQTLIFIGQEMN